MHTVTRAPDNSPHPPPDVTPYFRATGWAAIDAAVAAERRRRLSVA